MSGRRYGDPAPLLRPAGRVTKVHNESVANCLAFAQPTERPTTPPEIAKYRKSAIHEPGRVVKHFGTADDRIPHPKNEPFGHKNAVHAEGVDAVIKNFPESELMQWRLERQEDVYASSKREPLGASYCRGHKLPDGLGTEVPFGEVCEQGGVVGAKEMMKHPLAKELLFPVDFTGDADPDGTYAKMYVKTHSSYAPGEQRRRDYNWKDAKIDPDKHVFGYTEKEDPSTRNGVAKALNPSLGEGFKDTATIVPQMLEHFYITEKDHLGKVKKLGHGNRNIPADFAYGVASEGREAGEWGVRKLLVGGYSQEEQAPDVDLGKCIKPGLRNIAPEEKVFGLPSVRTDILRRYPQPTKALFEAGMTVVGSKGCADNTNYGEEPDAFALIYPVSGADRGVEERQYLEAYSKEKLKAFFQSAGVSLDGFDMYFEHACSVDNFSEGNQCCVLTYQRVKRHFEQQRLKQ
eukprot:1178806-Prorocentrum_minimum.AAC.2